MNIQILGTKGEIKSSLPYHSKKSGILIDGLILLDIGEKEFLKYEPKVIIITHLHPDHAYFVRRGHEEIPRTKAKIYAPEKPLNQEIANKVQIIEKAKKIQSYEVIPIPTHHSKYVKSQGYLIKKEKRSIFYTGDLFWINKEYRYLLNNLDLVITEGSFIRKGGMIRRDKKSGEIYGHTGIPNLIRIFKEYTKKILITHFGNWFYEDIRKSRKILAALGKENQVQISVGYDGMKCMIK